MVKRRPNLLLADPEKTILPKLNFFSSIGMAGPDIANVISSCPLILTCSLRNRIIPVYEFLKCALLFDDDLLIKAMSKPSRNFLQDVESVSAPNLLVLREIGMPQSVIQLILIHYFNLLCCNVDKFSNKIKEVISMGFCPRETKFVHALGVLVQLSESNFQDRIEVYGRLGWSKDDILSAFKKHPNFMKFSEKKIIAAVDFLINVMGMKRSELAAYPYFFSYSLKKRIIPRALVIKILMSKGVMEKNLRFHSVLKLSEKCFSERYVEKHLENIPYLQDVFEGRMCPQELGFQYGL
ncbi:hypothetical protein JCGZ_23746 [Jatropha curcas]|uniref:Uncharacterized protein n=2 Tax=Jatropha curcas TaxID=180498 RepID=A0A067LFE3_JATCU|nr:hypothetical protein JCGZ_23746 [Jatropha curcas]